MLSYTPLKKYYFTMPYYLCFFMRTLGYTWTINFNDMAKYY